MLIWHYNNPASLIMLSNLFCNRGKCLMQSCFNELELDVDKWMICNVYCHACQTCIAIEYLLNKTVEKKKKILNLIQYQTARIQ